MIDRYQGKRFFGFLLSVSALCGAYLAGDPAGFATFTAALVAIYGLYLGGQTYTDAKAK